MRAEVISISVFLFFLFFFFFFFAVVVVTRKLRINRIHNWCSVGTEKSTVKLNNPIKNT